MSEEIIKLGIVDDHPIVLEGLKSLFLNIKNPKYEVFSFSNGQSVLDYLNEELLDLILLDIALPDHNGVELCKIIKQEYPNIIVIGLSNQAEQSTIMQMLQNGASGFLLKDVPAKEILVSIEEARLGDIVMNAEVKKILATPTSSRDKLPSLTKREKQLLELLAKGLTTKEIADQIFLSKLTVDTYRKNLLQKFEVKNTSELLMLLVENKMI